MSRSCVLVAAYITSLKRVVGRGPDRIGVVIRWVMAVTTNIGLARITAGLGRLTHSSKVGHDTQLVHGGRWWRWCHDRGCESELIK